MMDAAFFVGKNELLSWLNALLTLNYTKVEQCANGAAYCQIMDACYPVMPAAIGLALHMPEGRRQHTVAKMQLAALHVQVLLAGAVVCVTCSILTTRPTLLALPDAETRRDANRGVRSLGGSCIRGGCGYFGMTSATFPCPLR